jgi:hypothetical protein
VESWPALHPEIHIKFGTISLQEKAEWGQICRRFWRKENDSLCPWMTRSVFRFIVTWIVKTT